MGGRVTGHLPRALTNGPQWNEYIPAAFQSSKGSNRPDLGASNSAHIDAIEKTGPAGYLPPHDVPALAIHGETSTVKVNQGYSGNPAAPSGHLPQPCTVPQRAHTTSQTVTHSGYDLMEPTHNNYDALTRGSIRHSPMASK